MKGFEDDNIQNRYKSIRDFMHTKMPDIAIISIDTIFKGERGNRSPTGICIMEVGSRSTREDILKKMRDDDLEMRDTKGQNIVFGRAKLGIQLERNRNMHRAFEAVQKSDVARGLDN